MFTLDQIKNAHAKVHSGADFKLSTSAKYETLTIAETSNIEDFKKDLKAHQLGQTNYPTFCADCAKSGGGKMDRLYGQNDLYVLRFRRKRTAVSSHTKLKRANCESY